MNKFTIKEPVYNTEVTFLYNCKEIDVIRLWNKTYPDDKVAVEPYDIADGRTIYGTTAAFIWVEKFNPKKVYDISVLVHEITHVTYHFMAYKGIKLKDSTQETFAYFHEYLVREILTKLKPSTN